MDEKLEQEIKYRLPGRAELDRLVGELGPPHQEERQENRYFDSNDLVLHRQGMLIRIRRFLNQPDRPACLTVKKAIALRPGYIQARESECAITVDDGMPAGSGGASGAARFFNDITMPLLQEVLSMLPDKAGIEQVATLCTHRRVYCLAEGEMALDIVDLAGELEFELELETTDRPAGERFLSSLFDRLSIHAHAPSQPKTSRLFAKLGRL